MSSRDMLALIILRDIHTKSVDFVLNYTQADIESGIFIELSIGFVVEVVHPREWVIRPNKNIYVLKYTSLAWFGKLKKVLKARGFKNPKWTTMCGI